MKFEIGPADEAANIAKHGLSLRDFKGFDSEPLVVMVSDDETDDDPEWTEEDFMRARPALEVLPPEVIAAFGKPRGRPIKSPETRKQNVSLRLSPDLLDELRASGPGWQTRAEEMLREGLRRAADKAA